MLRQRSLRFVAWTAFGDYEEADMSGFLEKMEKDYLELKENIRKNYK